MTQIPVSDLPITGTSKEPHEMLSTRMLPDGRTEVRINFSSLDIIATCKRKAYFSLKRKLIASNENAATLFGSSVHAAMEVWYTSQREMRKAATGKCDDFQSLMIAGQSPDAAAHGQCARCSAVFAFLRTGEPLRNLPEGDKRCLSNGVAILNNYFDTYSDDPFSILSDEIGPICERKIEFTLLETPTKVVTFFGTIDSVFVNDVTKTVIVVDHKTTSALGSDFYNRIRPNFQYIGYVLAAQTVLGLKSDTFMSNGIQVAKTKSGLARQVTQVTSEDFDELRLAVDWATDDFLKCVTLETWPQTTPNACTQWGGCQYRPICELPKSMQENIIEAQFNQKGNPNETVSA